MREDDSQTILGTGLIILGTIGLVTGAVLELGGHVDGAMIVAWFTGGLAIVFGMILRSM